MPCRILSLGVRPSLSCIVLTQSSSTHSRHLERRRETCDYFNCDPATCSSTATSACHNRRYTRLFQHGPQPLLPRAECVRAVVRQSILRDSRPHNSAPRREHHISSPATRNHTWVAVTARRSIEPCYADGPYQPDGLFQRVLSWLSDPQRVVPSYRSHAWWGRVYVPTAQS